MDSRWKRRARSAVLKWYARHGRTLPWRESADPYRIWISEIMLQQTTIAAVLPYFERFLQSFPDVGALAAAEQSSVLRLWEGLGYYSRARNLHRAAQVLVDRYQGQFPQTVQELRTLPGVGPYTAAAIASFAFQQPAGIVEANSLRLYSRLLGLQTDPRSTAGQKTLWDFANAVVSPQRPADFNQAVMDLGSTICRPAQPRCQDCPLTGCCAAFARNLQDQIPVAAKKTQLTAVTEVSLAISRRGRYLMRQRDPHERWAGLWDFVRFSVSDADVADLHLPASGPRRQRQQPLLFPEQARQPVSAAVAGKVAALTGLQIQSAEPILQIHHTVTRYRIRLLCLGVADASGRPRAGSGFRWVSADELARLPLSTTGRRFAEALS